MGILATEGYTQGFIPSLGYGGGNPIPEPPVTERVPFRSRFPFPMHVQPTEEYSYELFPEGHRVKPFRLLTAEKSELQYRYKTPHFVIQNSEEYQFESMHEPGLELKFSDLVEYYSFDGDTDAERLRDRTPNENHLTLLGGEAEPTFVTGQFGDAMLCDITLGNNSGAIADHCMFPNIVGGFSAFSIASWIAMPPVYNISG